MQKLCLGAEIDNEAQQYRTSQEEAWTIFRNERSKALEVIFISIWRRIQVS